MKPTKPTESFDPEKSRTFPVVNLDYPSTLPDSTKRALGIPTAFVNRRQPRSINFFPNRQSLLSSESARIRQVIQSLSGAKYVGIFPTIYSYGDLSPIIPYLKVQSRVESDFSIPTRQQLLAKYRILGIPAVDAAKVIGGSIRDQEKQTDAVQLTTISLVRHGISNIATMMVLGASKLSWDLPTFQLAYSGFLSRLTYQGVAVFPAIFVEEFVKNQGYSDITGLVAATLAESVIGVPIELHGYKKIFAEAGISTKPLDIAKMETKAFPAHFLRNMGFWMAMFLISDDSKKSDEPIKVEELAQKMSLGATISASTTLPGNWALLALQNAAGRGFWETQEKVWEIIKKDNMAKLFKGAGLRGVSGAISSIVMLPEFRKIIKDAISSENSQDETPGTQPKVSSCVPSSTKTGIEHD